MRKLIFILLVFLNFSVFGSKKAPIADTIKTTLNEVKTLINSGEWQPTNRAQFDKILELIEYIENSPIDSVVADLNVSLDTTSPIITRDIHFVSEAEKIDGYIRAWEINNSLINIENKAKHDLPLETIMVPEDQFTGMYSNLPLISYGEMYKLLNDSIVAYPDSILLMIANAKLSKSTNKMKEADSAAASFLDQERNKYNNKLIQQYRDSIVLAYRIDYLEKYTRNLKKQYTDSVAKHNLKVLNNYNDSISAIVNETFRRQMKALVAYVDKLPYELTINNYFEEPTKIKLQNDADWFQWVWLKNAQNDSIGLRVENLNKHHVRILVDETVNLSRLNQKQTVELERVTLKNEIDHSLRKVHVKQPKLSPWKLAGDAYAGFTQTYINQYWAKGGSSSGSIITTFKYDANYKKGKVSWESNIDTKLIYLIYWPEEGEVVERNWHKNTDNLELNSRFGYSAFKEWFYSADANFKTQFFNGYKNRNDQNPNSAFMAPAYLTFSGGFDYKPSSEFSMFLAPLSVKTTYVNDLTVDETAFGLKEGQTQKSRIGMAGKFEWNKKVIEDVKVRSKNSVFVNYGQNNDGESQFFKIPDFDSETNIDFKVNQFITTQLNFHFIYDKDVISKWTEGEVEMSGNKLQLKQFFTLGFTYKI